MRSALFFMVWMMAAALACGEEPAHSKKHMGDAEVYPPGKLKWQDGPPSLPAGSQVVVVDGDPRKHGPFVFRVKMPDGYRIPPHTHPKPERLTVLAGTLHVGMGDKFDEAKGMAMPAGTYASMPANMKHYAWATGETIVQLHGEGPWAIHYLNPADDPRKK